MQNHELHDIEEQTNPRRSFLKNASLTGLGLAGAAFTAGKLGAFGDNPVTRALGVSNQPVEAAGITDLDILNFALNLEYLEAEFYTVAVTGRTLAGLGIKTSGTGTEGPTVGGKQVIFPNSGVAATVGLVAEELYTDEVAHVKYLRNALGSEAIAKPKINLDALGIGFDSVEEFLILARAFEDTGVSAYGGAAPLISSKAYLGVAAQIALTEALHSGGIRLLCDDLDIAVPATDSLDVVPPPAGKKFFTTGANAFAVVRTTSEVLAIAFGSSKPGTTSGGFFPGGVNGNINTV